MSSAVWSTILGDTCNRAAKCNLQASARTAAPWSWPNQARKSCHRQLAQVVGTSLSSRHRHSSEAQLSSISAHAVSARRTDARQMHPQTNTNSTSLTTQALRISPGAAERQVEAGVEVGAACKAQSSCPLPPPPGLSPPLYFQSVGDILGATSPPSPPISPNPPHLSGLSSPHHPEAAILQLRYTTRPQGPRVSSPQQPWRRLFSTLRTCGGGRGRASGRTDPPTRRAMRVPVPRPPVAR